MKMNSKQLEMALQSAIDGVICPIGKWRIDTYVDEEISETTISLIWEIKENDLHKLGDDWDSDFPWSDYGGNEILRKAGFVDTGNVGDSRGEDWCQERYGDDIFCSFINWRFEGNQSGY